MHVLVLGGTALARQLAELADAAGITLSYSLAGRTRSPQNAPGRIVSGGFGGAAGLAEWLTAERVDAVIDATHSFAAGMTANAFHACQSRGVPLLRLEPRSWADRDEGWSWAEDHPQAARLAAQSGADVFLTVGRQNLAAYLEPLRGRVVVTRMVEAPDVTLPESWRLLLARGPFQLADERAVFAGPPALGCLVTKDAGGERLDPKLIAASEVGASVVILARPKPPGELAVVHQPDQALAWLTSRT